MENAIKSLGVEVLMNAALERVRGEMAALKPDELQPITLDISAAVATVLGVLPEVTALRDRIVKELPSFDVARFDRLEDYALALNFAHAKFLSATQPPDDLVPVVEQAAKARERLLAECNALVLDGVVAEGQLGQLKGANGYKNIATDLTVLSNVLLTAWPQVQGKTRLTEQDLDEGLRLSARLLRIVGVREQGPAQLVEASSQRLRAYTLLAIAYDDARRAVAFLRAGEGDADDIAPPLHPGRPRPKKSSATGPEVPTTPNGGATSSTAGVPSAASGGGTAAGASTGGTGVGAGGGGTAGGPFVQ